MQSLAHRLANDFIRHDGGKCPCVGEWVEVAYTDGPYERGIAQDGIHWHYVLSYRLIADPGEMV